MSNLAFLLLYSLLCSLKPIASLPSDSSANQLQLALRCRSDQGEICSALLVDRNETLTCQMPRTANSSDKINADPKDGTVCGSVLFRVGTSEEQLTCVCESAKAQRVACTVPQPINGGEYFCWVQLGSILETTSIFLPAIRPVEEPNVTVLRYSGFVRFVVSPGSLQQRLLVYNTPDPLKPLRSVVFISRASNQLPQSDNFDPELLGNGMSVCELNDTECVWLVPDGDQSDLEYRYVYVLQTLRQRRVVMDTFRPLVDFPLRLVVTLCSCFFGMVLLGSLVYLTIHFVRKRRSKRRSKRRDDRNGKKPQSGPEFNNLYIDPNEPLSIQTVHIMNSNNDPNGS